MKSPYLSGIIKTVKRVNQERVSKVLDYEAFDRDYEEMRKLWNEKEGSVETEPSIHIERVTKVYTLSIAQADNGVNEYEYTPVPCTECGGEYQVVHIGVGDEKAIEDARRKPVLICFWCAIQQAA